MVPGRLDRPRLLYPISVAEREHPGKTDIEPGPVQQAGGGVGFDQDDIAIKTHGEHMGSDQTNMPYFLKFTPKHRH